MTAISVPVRVETGLIKDLQRFGAADVSACFSCGVCTATCPLSENDATFPRRIIRYAQVGMRERLLSSKELWTCYSCGECSESCPMQAEPAEFMAAARRYAIASYDHTGLARTMYTSPWLGTFIALALAAFFALFMVTAHGPQEGASLNLFGFIPSELIHNIGIGVLVVVFLAGLSGILTMARRVGHSEGVTWRALLGGRAALARTWAALWQAVGVESLGQRRFRADCETSATQVPWFRRRWLIHAATMWGFLGLLAATLLDYGLELIGWKATGTPVPIWYPIRLLGTVAGVALIYGTSLLVVDRLRGANRALRHSAAADWTLLALLWVTGVTGFAIELALYLPNAPAWGYWVFLFHVAVAMELVMLAPFMKFAHAVYRPVALFFLALRTGQGAAG
ncbi:MAG: 4Fe-4S dicluster domain-containing protein [Candidatus Limnocylindria bacterium]